MDRGPLRVQRPAAETRATASRQESQRVVEEPQAATPTHHTTQRSKKDEPKKKSKKWLWVLIGFVVVAAIAGCVWFGLRGGAAPGIDSGKYQAVFFTNGQVYFGKLTPMNDGYMKLTDVFYLQSQTADDTKSSDSENPQEGSAENNNNLQLIKLGQEVHGPEDALIISRDQVLFYENLKSDGKVAQTIEQYKNQ